MFQVPGGEEEDDQRRGHPLRHVHPRLRQLRGAAQALPPKVQRGHEGREQGSYSAMQSESDVCDTMRNVGFYFLGEYKKSNDIEIDLQCDQTLIRFWRVL